jgi:hypothetical protein
MRYGIPLMCMAALIAGLAGCKASPQQAGASQTPPKAVTVSDLPAAARATVERLVANGTVKSVEQEGMGDKAVYDIEATVGGKDVEYDVAADGKVLTSQEGVPFGAMPHKVQTTAAKYFGSAQGLVASKEIEGAKTLYEVEGKRRGISVTLKLSDAGKILEVEKE